MSGMSRRPSFGTPVPLCHEGLEKIVLAPPPPALKLVESFTKGSFQAFSVMYCRAVPAELIPVHEGPQSVVAAAHPVAIVTVAAASPVNSLPPTPVTSGIAAGTSTARPCVAEVTLESQSAAPSSPEGPLIV